MSKVRQLLGDTVVYGLSTILGRLLNWLLLPLYIRTLSIEDNGYLTYLYGFIAIFQVLLSFGFETGFFRFAKSDNYQNVFTALTKFTFFSCSIFFAVIVLFNNTFEKWIEVEDKGPVLILMAGILFIDTISNLPFSLMRFKRESIKYSIYRFGQVLLTIVLNLLFLVLIPYLSNYKHGYFNFEFDDNCRLLYVFVANFLASLVILILLSKYIFKNLKSYKDSIVKEVLWYSFPNILVGFFGMINFNIDRLMIPRLIHSDDVYSILGIYGANFKLGVLMAIFTQSFRLAFEPFFFKNQDEGNITNTYSRVMNIFVGFGMLIFLGVLFYLPLINVVLTKAYLPGNDIIPFILLAQLFFGIYYSLSLWYKVTDKTYFALIFTLIGTVLIVGSNLFLIPVFGYIGAAISGLVCYATMAILSYIIGQKYYPVPYNLKRLLGYIFGGLVLYFISLSYSDFYIAIRLGLNTILIGIFVLFFVYTEDLFRVFKILKK